MKKIILACSLLALCISPLVAQTAIPSGASYDIGFSPGGSSLAVVEKAIKAAKSEILVACYEFTSREIAAALEDDTHHGVKVRIVADWKASQDRSSEIAALRKAGIPIRLDHRYAIEHDKFMVIDGVVLETGSFNYTSAAVQHNAENALVLWNVPQIAKVYSYEWERMWEESK
jgi:phosphatidylserine/phosphatidylglycerophosphate/cardiolipin synthase-like enzyme